MTTVRKLIVEVVCARNLQPKDGHGKSSPYAILHFHGQRYKTKTVIENLNPFWNEVVKFNVAQSSADVFDDKLEINVRHNRKFGPTTRNKNLGRVSLDAEKFVTKGGELIYYDLKKHCWSCCIHGEIGLKIYFVDEVVPPPPAPNPPPPTPAPKPPENTETPPPVPPAQPPVSAPPYHFPREYRSCSCSCSCSSSLAEEESYPVDLNLSSILIVFVLCFLILCLIVAF